MTRAQLKAVLKTNLAEASVTDGYFDANEINEAIQDAYSYIVAMSLCYVKRQNGLSWQNYLPYYDFVTLGVTDYIATCGIFNNVNNQWLRDDIPMRGFDVMRTDWEMWVGCPQYWGPHSLKYVAIAPRWETASGTYDLVYYAKAPTLTSDSDTFVIAEDKQDLLEFRCTAQLLETANEESKAGIWNGQFDEEMESYIERTRSLAKSDLMNRLGESQGN
jgi:hypothetical protein